MAGRPSPYKKSFCKRTIELGKQGKNLAQIAAEFGVCKRTVTQWTQDHPEYSLAYEEARSHCEDWWLKLAQNRANGTQKDGSDRLIAFMLSAGFGYREKTDATVTAQVDANVSGKVSLDWVGDKPEGL